MNVILVNRRCFSNLLWASGSCYIMSKRGIFVQFSRNMAWLIQKWRTWICFLLNVSYILAIFTHILDGKRIILCCFCIRKIKYHVICKICFFIFDRLYIRPPINDLPKNRYTALKINLKYPLMITDWFILMQ